MPDAKRLRGWFQAALTKKLAVVSQPPAFWENDPKRNPDAVRLLWAAIILDDLEGYRTVQSIMAVEKSERHLRDSILSRMEEGIEKLLTLASSAEMRIRLQKQADRLKETVS